MSPVEESAAGARGLISIGTNSTRLLIIEGESIAAAASVGTRLGRGLDQAGRLELAARERTLATIRDYVGEIRGHRATVDVIATSALRRAADADAFGAEVAALVGIAPRIITGDEEAAFSFAGATYGADASRRVGVLDVGGGSTELAVGRPGAIERTVSLEIGAVRLAERHPLLLGERGLTSEARATLVAQARDDCRAILAPLATFAPFDELLAVGGTVFTAAAMACGDPHRDGVPLAGLQRRNVIAELLARDLEARRLMPQIRPQRADILPAGLIIVDTACQLLGMDTLRVSHSDLLAGYLRSALFRAAVLPG